MKRVIPPKSDKSGSSGNKVWMHGSDDTSSGGDMDPSTSHHSLGASHMKSGSFEKKSRKKAPRAAKESWAKASLTQLIGKSGMNSTRSPIDGTRTSSLFGKTEAAKWRKMKKEFIEEMRYLSKLRHPVSFSFYTRAME